MTDNIFIIICHSFTYYFASVRLGQKLKQILKYWWISNIIILYDNISVVPDYLDLYKTMKI